MGFSGSPAGAETNLRRVVQARYAYAMDTPTPEPQQESPSESPESPTTPGRPAPRNCLDFDDLKTYVYLSRIADRWFQADDKKKAEWKIGDEPAIVMADFGGGAAFFHSGSVPDCEVFALVRKRDGIDKAEPSVEYERVFVCENGEEGYYIREASYDGAMRELAPTHRITDREYPELDDKPAGLEATLLESQKPDDPARPLNCIGMSDPATCDHVLPTVEHWFHMPAQQRRSWEIDDLGQAIVVIDFGGGPAYFKHGTLDECEAYAVEQKTKKRFRRSPPFLGTEARIFVCEQGDVGYILREVKDGGEIVSLHKSQIVPTAADRVLDAQASGPEGKPAISDPDDLSDTTNGPSQPGHPGL